jgi:hypothetical protein
VARRQVPRLNKRRDRSTSPSHYQDHHTESNADPRRLGTRSDKMGSTGSRRCVRRALTPSEPHVILASVRRRSLTSPKRATAGLKFWDRNTLRNVSLLASTLARTKSPKRIPAAKVRPSVERPRTYEWTRSWTGSFRDLSPFPCHPAGSVVEKTPSDSECRRDDLPTTRQRHYYLLRSQLVTGIRDGRRSSSVGGAHPTICNGCLIVGRSTSSDHKYSIRAG